MVGHMKTTIDLPDPLLEAAKARAREPHRTLKDIMEEGLRRVLAEEPRKEPFKLRHVPPMRGELQPEFRDAPWEKIRDEIYGLR